MGDHEGGADDAAGDALPFSLLLDKSLPSLVETAAWNPGKDLLAVVTKDHQVVVHRLNWQRLWAVTPDLKVTAICWRPDGKALAVGHNNGSIAIHDVENGDVLRKTQTHQVAVECLYWAEESQSIMGSEDNVFIYEDRTLRFFPPPPKPPPMPGTAPSFDMSSVLGSMEDLEGKSLKGTTRDVKHRLDILCSGDRDGLICLSAFGVFPIGKLGMRELTITDLGSDYGSNKSFSCQLLDACALQVSLSNDLRHMTVVCSGRSTSEGGHVSHETGDAGIYCISVNTALLGNRRKELRQVALQASNVEELVDVLQTSLTVMEKHWSEAIDSFKEKISAFSKLILEHGSTATPKDEFLGLLTWGYASPALQQFLAVSLGEAGLKRLSKSIDTAARELHNIISEHMQPAAEMITFRLGELRGLSRWKARLSCVGLEEALLDGALEHAGMLLVQLERLVHIISDTTGGFRPFFVWLVKVLRQVNRESLPQSEQLPNVDSMAVATFLQTDFEKDQIGEHFRNSPNASLEVSRSELVEMMDEVAIMGGYKDSKFLQRTLAQEVALLAQSCQEAFTMPLKVVSPQLGSPHMIPLGEIGSSPSRPMSLAYFEMKQNHEPLLQSEDTLPSVEYVCFHNSGVKDPSVVGILRGFGSDHGGGNGNKCSPAEASSLHLDESLRCIDLALYKKRQLLLLVTDRDSGPEGSGKAWLMLLQLDSLIFHELTPSTFTERDPLHLRSSGNAGPETGLGDGKVRELSQADVVIPMAVSASRGLACVFTSQRRVLLFDLEEDEEAKGEDMD